MTTSIGIRPIESVAAKRIERGATKPRRRRRLARPWVIGREQGQGLASVGDDGHARRLDALGPRLR